MHIFFEIGLISLKQSDFRPGGSFINQLLSTNHEILSAFAIGIEVQWLVFQIFKTFDKVWQSGFPGMLALFFFFFFFFCFVLNLANPILGLTDFQLIFWVFQFLYHTLESF